MDFKLELQEVKEDLEKLDGRVGTLEQEVAVVKADMDSDDRWFAHMDKRMDKQDDSLKWIFRSIIVAILTFTIYLAVYVVEHH